MTPAGREAERIARWAWDDPAGRVQEALRRVGEMARNTADAQELREIGDATSMLSRLAGTIVHDGPSILGQLLESHDAHGG